MDKLNLYYQHSAESDAHIMAMGKFLTHTDRVLALCRNQVLNPKMKMTYFVKHWPESLTSEVEDVVQKRIS